MKKKVKHGYSEFYKTSNFLEQTEELTDLMQRFETKNIYNFDETGLFYCDLPMNSYSDDGEICVVKSSKKRVAVLFCCNSLGESFSPVIVGNMSSKKIETKFNYFQNKTAWMNSLVFQTVLLEWN